MFSAAVACTAMIDGALSDWAENWQSRSSLLVSSLSLRCARRRSRRAGAFGTAWNKIPSLRSACVVTKIERPESVGFIGFPKGDFSGVFPYDLVYMLTGNFRRDSEMGHARRGLARRGKAGRGSAGLGTAWRGPARQGKASVVAILARTFGIARRRLSRVSVRCGIDHNRRSRYHSLFKRGKFRIRHI